MAEARGRVPVNAVDAVAASAPQQPAAPSSASRLAFADGLRGLAAFWVVLYHASEGGHLTQLKAGLPRRSPTWCSTSATSACRSSSC
jgi:hypothetical protein